MIALLLQSLSTDPLVDKVWGVLIAAVVGQIVVGALFLIGFVAVVRRFMDREIPAKLASLDDSLKNVHNDLEALSKELIQMRRDVDRHGYQIQTLEDWRRSQPPPTAGGGARRR